MSDSHRGRGEVADGLRCHDLVLREAHLDGLLCRDCLLFVAARLEGLRRRRGGRSAARHLEARRDGERQIVVAAAADGLGERDKRARSQDKAWLGEATQARRRAGVARDSPIELESRTGAAVALDPDGTDTWITEPGVAYAGITTSTCWPVGAATSMLWPGVAPSGICTSITMSPT